MWFLNEYKRQNIYKRVNKRDNIINKNESIFLLDENDKIYIKLEFI